MKDACSLPFKNKGFEKITLQTVQDVFSRFLRKTGTKNDITRFQTVQVNKC